MTSKASCAYPSSAVHGTSGAPGFDRSQHGRGRSGRGSGSDLVFVNVGGTAQDFADHIQAALLPAGRCSTAPDPSIAAMLRTCYSRSIAIEAHAVENFCEGLSFALGASGAEQLFPPRTTTISSRTMPRQGAAGSKPATENARIASAGAPLGLPARSRSRAE